MENIDYVYVCGFYTSDDNRGKNIIAVFKSENDAIQKMIHLANTEYSWLFRCDLTNLNITTYQDLNDYIINKSKYYYYSEYVHYIYVEKVILE